MLYETHYKEGKKVWFNKFDTKIAGLLFLPKNFNENEKYPAIVSKRTMFFFICLAACTERIYSSGF